MALLSRIFILVVEAKFLQDPMRPAMIRLCPAWSHYPALQITDIVSVPATLQVHSPIGLVPAAPCLVWLLLQSLNNGLLIFKYHLLRKDSPNHIFQNSEPLPLVFPIHLSVFVPSPWKLPPSNNTYLIYSTVI